VVAVELRVPAVAVVVVAAVELRVPAVAAGLAFHPSGPA